MCNFNLDGHYENDFPGFERVSITKVVDTSLFENKRHALYVVESNSYEYFKMGLKRFLEWNRDKDFYHWETIYRNGRTDYVRMNVGIDSKGEKPEARLYIYPNAGDITAFTCQVLSRLTANHKYGAVVLLDLSFEPLRRIEYEEASQPQEVETAGEATSDAVSVISTDDIGGGET